MGNQEIVYAGFWRRLLAVVLDTLVLWIPVYVFRWMIDEERWNPWVFHFVDWCQMTVIWTIYYGILESSKHQGTVGKMVLRLKVTDVEGGRISFLRACGRYLAQWLSLLPVGIGFMMIGWTRKKQGIHDMVCGCLVIRQPNAASQVSEVTARKLAEPRG